VHYCVFGGAVVNWLFVRRDVEKIFAFRTGQLRKLFGVRRSETTIDAVE
jgi:hypothetical protein